MLETVGDKDEKKKKKSFKDFDGSKYIDVEPTIDEAASKTVVVAWGRMNPITAGHEKLVKKVVSVARANKAVPELYLTHSVDPKKNPLSYDDKIKYAQKAFGSVVRKSQAKTVIQLMQELNKSYKSVILIAGSDRIKEFDTLLNKYNGREYNFDEIKVVSAGQRDEDSDDVSGISGTKMREYAVSDTDKFEKNLPRKLKGDADTIASLVRKGMNMSEEIENLDGENVDEAVLNRMQRRQRSISARKNRFKMKRGREKAARKMASSEVLKKRARKQAISNLKKKFSKNKRYAELSSGEKEVIDKRIQKLPAARLAAMSRKLLPSVKKAERDRKTHKVKQENTELNLAFENFLNENINMEEGNMWGQRQAKRPHMLLDKNNKVKFDKRFKMYQPNVQESLEDSDLDDIYDLMESTEEYVEEGKKKGLWDNIHAKRRRIKAGSGERMRKPGSKGAPTDQDFKDASESMDEEDTLANHANKVIKDKESKKEKESFSKKMMSKKKKKSDMDEVTKSAIKRPVVTTGPDGKTRTVMRPTRSVEKDERGNDKIREEAGAGEEGTNKLTKRFKRDTPNA